ncbi:hypothetical protein [Flectobacillus rivi]|uniref:HTH cro/C1-type domain-containing protein n=1 Tax=Flectobacillus rivi TaxID=2984209 RepID=A0ABT6Z1W5_9BACT|nr:hypothetical protein [Flectobacillus rivi]MDI9874629.1 hypothetical protein [Flectobacillus rivi]
MELTREMIKETLRKRNMTELEFCESVGYSQPSLHRFYNSGNIRAKNARKIIQFLELNDNEKEETQFKSSSNVDDSGVLERLLRRIEELTIENYTLKKELGKCESTFLPALSA